MQDKEKKQFLLTQVNFGSGVVEDCGIDGAEGFRVEYRRGLCLEIWWWKGGRYHNCYLKKGRTTIVPYTATQLGENFLRLIQHCVQEIEGGKYDNKKSISEQVREVVARRGLTSCMNNTKWNEFRQAMENEMPFPPPYIYKTLFEGEDGGYFDFSEDVGYTDHYDAESFAGYNYKIIEWVKVRPRYYSYEGGVLAGRRTMHEAGQEFVEILRKYSIPFEAGDGVYIIYGYR